MKIKDRIEKDEGSEGRERLKVDPKYLHEEKPDLGDYDGSDDD